MISNCACFLKNYFFQSRTIREFDSNFTAKQFGFKDVNDYYTHATLHNKLHKITVPTLCISAGDDPFQPFEGKKNSRKCHFSCKSDITLQLNFIYCIIFQCYLHVHNRALLVMQLFCGFRL